MVKRGKDLMENGGKAVLVGNQGINDQKPGDPAGEGKGVKIPFKYKGLGLNDLEGIYVKLLEATYKGNSCKWLWNGLLYRNRRELADAGL